MSFIASNFTLSGLNRLVDRAFSAVRPAADPRPVSPGTDAVPGLAGDYVFGDLWWHTGDALMADQLRRDPVQLLIGARTHLCWNPKSRWPQMDESDIDAYEEIGWRLDRLASIQKDEGCEISWPINGGNDVQACRNTAVGFCVACGREICLYHAERAGQVTYCDSCVTVCA